MKITKDVKQFLLDKTVAKWMKDNPEYFEDINKLFGKLIMFELKYGVSLRVEIDNKPPKQGRNLGIADKVFKSTKG